MKVFCVLQGLQPRGKRAGKAEFRKGSFWIPTLSAGLGDLGVSLSPPGLSVPAWGELGKTRRGRARVGAGPPTAAGQDLPSRHGRRAGLLPRGGGRGAGSWWPRSCSHSTCRRQTARALPGRRLPPPPSGCSGGAGGGARAEPEPSRCPSPARYRGRRWAGRPCHCSRRLRVRAGGASSAGKGEAPAPLQSFGEVLSPHIPGLRLRELPLGFFRAALHAVLPGDPRRSSCPHSRRPWLGRRLAWDLQRLTLYLGSVCLKFPRSARCS